MEECSERAYIPVANAPPEIQPELLALNIVQVRTDRETCREKHQTLVEWILENHNENNN
jgi:hypothetical protein